MRYGTEGVAAMREIADCAYHYAESNDEENAYCQGVEDVLRYLTGDAAKTPELARILEYATR